MRSTLTTKHSELPRKHKRLLDETCQMEEASQALTTPSKQADADEQRISSFASLNEQCARNQKRLAELEVEITRYGRPAPNHVASPSAVQDL